MKIGFLITARLKSTRLPLKILKDLNGKTVIERVIDRAKEVKDVSGIVLCTSYNPQDKPLVDIAKRNNINYVTGEEEDVFKRLFDTVKLFGFDYVVSITADNPLFSIEYANSITESFKKDNVDFIRVYGLPLGAAAYGLKAKAMEVACEIKQIVDTEFWEYLFECSDIFNVLHIEVNGKVRRPDLRLTLDYDKDYELIHNVYANINFTRVLNLESVIDYLDQHPEINKINKDCLQRDLDEQIKERINEGYKNNLDRIRRIKGKIYEKSKEA